MKLIDFVTFVLYDTMQKTQILIIKTSGFMGCNIKIYEILMIIPALD